MRISLNLATRPYTDLGPALKCLRIAIATLALVAISLALSVRVSHPKAEQARASARALDGEIAAIAQQRQDYQNFMRQPENVQLLAAVTALNKLIDEKSFSWTLAIEDLETVLPVGVQVTTMEPTRSKEGQISLHLRVIGPRDHAVELVRNLEHSRRFLLPRIVGESAETTGGPGERLEPVSASNRVNFDIFADYNPASPEEPRFAKMLEEKPAAGIPRASSPASAPTAPGPKASRAPNAALPSVKEQPKLSPNSNLNKPNPGRRP